MGNIVLLDDLTINKIAAGEVIERPASVVKELVENSIDAGANNITVEIRNGGISYIRVVDNGKGIMNDDMEIAFERHATSKIRVADDLEKVKSMGFRGEALASIAAISKIEVQSKTADEEMGYKVAVEGGKILDKQEIGCQNGTTITIEDLFYNTPVRYKFLRKDFTEAGYIEDTITRIALAHPEIAIKLINTGKNVIQTSGNGDFKSVIYNIYGKDIAENIIEINYEYEDVKVTGVIGKPSIARSNRSNQLFFVNKRYVKDKTLTSSAEQAFKDKIPTGKFGFLVLNIEMNPSQVDVNVHPAKLEVRFENEQKIFKAVYHGIKDKLAEDEITENKDELEFLNEKIEGFKQEAKKEETYQIETKSEKGLFKKFFSKKEEEPEEPTVIEQLYNSRQIDSTMENKESNFESIMQKMAEMQSSVYEFNKNKEENSNENNEIEKQEENEEIDEIPQVQEEIKEEFKEEQIKSEESKQEEKYEELKQDYLNQYENNNESVIEENTEASELQDTKIIDTNPIIENIDVENTQVIDTIQEQELTTEDDEDIPVIEYDLEKKFEEMYTSVFGTSPKLDFDVKEEEEKYEIPQPEMKPAENISIFNEESEKKVIPNYRYIGLAFGNYVVIEFEKEIYIIDERAASERIVYEELKKNYNNENKKDSQMMLLPDIIDLSSKEMSVARENIDIFEKAGFVLEEFGENTIKLVGVPSICMELDTKELFIDILNQINKVPITEKEEIEEKFIETLAKKIGEKAKIYEEKREIEQLIEKLLDIENPFVCKDGKPVAIEMTKEEIEKKFSRR